MFRAYDPEHDRLAAVKWFRLDVPPERVHQLVAEFEKLIAAEINHPAIAAPILTGIAGTNAFLAQEYFASEPLDIVVRDHGPAPVPLALKVAAQIADALNFAADAGIAHGAMHPRDVLLSAADVRVTGLGVASALATVGVSAPVRRPYTAPERSAGALWNRRADVFSLAAILHDLLWGRPVAGLGAEAADALTELPGGNLDALRVAFARAMAEDPAERYDTALELVDALRNASNRTEDASRRSRSKAAAPAAPATPGKPVALADDLSTIREREPMLPLDDPGPLELGRLGILDDLDVPAEVDLRAALGDPDFGETPAGDQDREIRPATSVNASHDPLRLVAGGSTSILRPVPPPMLEADPDEPTHSAVRPLVLALVVGLALGFAGGYFLGVRERPSATAAAIVAAPAAAPEGAVGAGGDARQAAVAVGAGGASDSSPKPDAASGAAGDLRAPVTASKGISPARGQARAVGRLLVRSVPPGADVSVDGRERGRTPVALEALVSGPHQVRVSREGYASQERRLEITEARPEQVVTVTLLRSRAASKAAAVPAAATPAAAGSSAVPSAGRSTGEVSVESRPAGASVYVDGRLVGSTPLTLADVAVGEHVVYIEREGFGRWTSAIKVLPNEKNRVRASLEK